MSVTSETNISNSLSLPLGGIQFDLFLTRDSSSSLVPLKYSTNHTFRVNSILSSFNSCMFGFVGVGVNFKPFSKSLVSCFVSFLVDRLII